MGTPMPRGCAWGSLCWHPLAHNPRHLEGHWVDAPMPKVLTVLGVCWVGTPMPEPPASGGHPPPCPESSLSRGVLDGHSDARAPQHLQGVLGGKSCRPGLWVDLGCAIPIPRASGSSGRGPRSMRWAPQSLYPGAQAEPLGPLGTPARLRWVCGVGTPTARGCVGHSSPVGGRIPADAGLGEGLFHGQRMPGRRGVQTKKGRL